MQRLTVCGLGQQFYFFLNSASIGGILGAYYQFQAPAALPPESSPYFPSATWPDGASSCSGQCIQEISLLLCWEFDQNTSL